VTLLEAREFTLLRVERLGEDVMRRNMAWFHLPIVDGSAADEQFERQWENAGAELCSILRSGRDVLVHCRGGSSNEHPDFVRLNPLSDPA